MTPMAPSRRWQDMTPTEVLDAFPALTLTQVAYCIGALHLRGKNKGLPDRRQVLNLIYAGKLPVIDPSRPVPYWTVSNTNVRNYLSR